MRSPVSGIHVQPPQLELRPLTHQVARNSDNAHQCTSVMSAPDASAFHRMDRRYVAPTPGMKRQFAYDTRTRSEEHTSELQSLMRISYAVFCLKKKREQHNTRNTYKKR